MRVVQYKECTYCDVHSMICDNEILQGVKLKYHEYAQEHTGIQCEFQFGVYTAELCIQPVLVHSTELPLKWMVDTVHWYYRLTVSTSGK